VEFQDPDEFLKIEQDEEALEYLEQSIEQMQAPTAVQLTERGTKRPKVSNGFMDSPQTLEDE
jgi:hypothetical protein